MSRRLGLSIGAHNNNLDFLLTQADKHGVRSGDELIRDSHGVYNEVVAVANRDGQQVQLKGFFYKVTQSGNPLNAELARKMQDHASRLGLPVIEIREPGLYAQDKVESIDNKLAVQFAGKRFLLDGYEPQHLFNVYDERGYSHFVSPQELEPALGFAVDFEGITKDRAIEIEASYQEVDKQRQTPKVEFDEDGSVKRISCRSGYGEDEEETALEYGGHGSHTNLARKSEYVARSMLSAGRPEMTSISQFYRPMSPPEGDQMVAAACAQLSDEEAMKVRDWYRGHRDVLEKQWGYHLEARRSMGFVASRF